jgi:7-carboxy-7-deazaguanine synthase
MTVGDIHQRLRGMHVDYVCLSGGEPLMHASRLDGLMTPEWKWHAETNGTIVPPDYWHTLAQHTTVSPKINTRDKHKKRIKPVALRAWNEYARAGAACFKFVCAKPSDLDLVGQVVHDIGIDDEHVWIMPEGTNAATVLPRHRALAPHIEARGWNTTTRLHTLLWGEERGR